MPAPLKTTDGPAATVALRACADYREETVSAALDGVLAPLTGLDRLAPRGARVLVKPNLLSDHAPDEAVTTHPEVVRGMIRRLRSAGFDVAVADSPASAVTLERVWERTGFAAMCAEEKTPLLNLEKSGSRSFRVDGFAFNLARPIVEAAAVVNMPKVKTHTLTTLTCGVKNLYGAVPGYAKAGLHKRHPGPRSFGRLLRAIHAAVAPSLTVADGVVGMAGEGPANGTPVSLGFLAASADAEALDRALCELLGLPPRAVPYLATEPPGATAWVGDDPGGLRPAAFRKPRTLKARLIPERLARAFAPWVWVRPRFGDACVRCGRCVAACPTEALALETEASAPRLSPGACIGCCCCHEICPAKAVTMRQSPLLRAWGVFKGL